jgi:hypothetical protein
MDIFPSNYSNEPTAPVDVRQKNRLPSWNRRKQHAAATAAANKAASVKTKASSAAAAAAKIAEDAQTGSSSGNSRKPCLKQGGLSNALSREPSVRHGTALYDGNSNRSVSRGPTPVRLSCGKAEFIDANEGMGSWAMRKVTFSQNGRTDSAHSDAINSIAMPNSAVSDNKRSSNTTNSSSSASVDPDALAAALASLEVGSGHAHVSTGSFSPGIIIGDTSLANESTELFLNLDRPSAVGFSNTAVSGGSSGSPGEIHGARSIISDPAVASETQHGVVASSRRARSLDFKHAADAEEAAALALATATGDGDGTAEWNAKFLKRWRAVKQRARLQALGMRSIWKLNSPHGSGEGGRRVHHPPELLTNELPDGPPELPLSPLSNAESGSIKGDTEFSMSPGSIRVASNTLSSVGLGSGNGRGGAQTTSAGAPGVAGIHKDPSLATMLRGDVAEVC